MRERREKARGAGHEPAEGAFRASEPPFRTVVASPDDATIAAGDCGTSIFRNHGARGVFGHGEEDVQGRPLRL